MKERLQLKKWLNGITNVLFCLCLLVVILIVLQVFVVTSFKIPSDSMEPSLLAGDGEIISGMMCWCSIFLIRAGGTALRWT